MPKKSLKPSERKAPTLIDVAKVAGVSPITVSRALHQPGRVSEKTRSKVDAAVKKTGYLPNMVAGSLATQSSRLVALIVPTVANPIFAETVRAITDTLDQAGYQTLLGLSGYDRRREEDLLEAILCRRPDGIILTGAGHTDISRTRLAAAAIPVVETWDLGDEPLDAMIGFSHREVGEHVAQYLLEHNHRRIAVISADDERARQRLDGLRHTLQSAGVAPVQEEMLQTPARFSQGRETLARMLEQGLDCTALYCSSDTLAHGAITEANARGLKVPDDLAVIGFGDLEFASHAQPSITTVQINGAEIGLLAAEHLLRRMENPGTPEPPSRVNIGFQIITRDSA